MVRPTWTSLTGSAHSSVSKLITSAISGNILSSIWPTPRCASPLLLTTSTLSTRPSSVDSAASSSVTSPTGALSSAANPTSGSPVPPAMMARKAVSMLLRPTRQNSQGVFAAGDVQIVKMAGSDENCLGVIRPANAQGGLRAGSGKFTAGIGHNRRALSSINRNIVEAAPYPYAVNKRGGLSEKQVIPYNNQLIPVHRPMTRKLAAQMSYHYDGYSGSKQEFIFATSDEGVEKSTQVPSAMQEASRSYDCILKSASQKNPNVSEDVPHITRCTRTMQNPSLIDSLSFSHRTPRSLSAETVWVFQAVGGLDLKKQVQ